MLYDPAEIVAGDVVEEPESPPNVATLMFVPETEYEDPILVLCTIGPSTVSWTESVIRDVISAALTGVIIKKGNSRVSFLTIL